MNWQFRHTLLVLCTTAYFVTMASRLVIGPLVPMITTDLDMSTTLIGTCLSGMWFAYALTQFPSGALGARLGDGTVIGGSLGGTAILSIALVFVPTPIFFGGCVVLIGAFSGLHYPAATTWLAAAFSDRIGFAIGVHSIGTPLAGLIAPVAGVWLAGMYGWRAGAGFAAILGVPMFLIFVRLVPRARTDRSHHLMSRGAIVGSLLSAFRNPAIRFTILTAAIGAFVWQGVASFLPTFLVEFRELSTGTAAVIFSAYFVIQAIVRPAIGSLSDRWGTDRVIVLCMCSIGAGLGTYVVWTTRAGIVVGTICLGVGLSWAAAVEPRLMSQLAPRQRALSFGLARSGYLLLGSLGSVGVGLLADVFGWGIAFGVLILPVMVISVIASLNLAFGLGY